MFWLSLWYVDVVLVVGMCWWLCVCFIVFYFVIWVIEIYVIVNDLCN